jgi:hypothetical protein
MKRLIAIALLLCQAAFGQTSINLKIPLPTLPVAITPVMHVETISLLALGQGTTSEVYQLLAIPIASMGAVVSFASSQVGGSVVVPVASIAQSITFTLPSYTFTSQDVITITYWSTK